MTNVANISRANRYRLVSLRLYSGGHDDLDARGEVCEAEGVGGRSHALPAGFVFGLHDLEFEQPLMFFQPVGYVNLRPLLLLCRHASLYHLLFHHGTLLAWRNQTRSPT